MGLMGGGGGGSAAAYFQGPPNIPLITPQTISMPRQPAQPMAGASGPALGGYFPGQGANPGLPGMIDPNNPGAGGWGAKLGDGLGRLGDWLGVSSLSDLGTNAYNAASSLNTPGTTGGAGVGALQGMGFYNPLSG